MTDEGLANLLATVPDLDKEKASLLASILLADPQDFDWNEPREKLTPARVKPSSLRERQKYFLGWWSKSLAGYQTKAAGEPCEQGETAAQTGCIPITPVAPHVGPSPLEGPRYGAKINSEKAKVGQVMSSTPQSLAEIKKKCGIEKNWVWNYLDELVKNGFVEKVDGKYKKKKTIPPPTSTTETVTPPKVEAKPKPASVGPGNIEGPRYGAKVDSEKAKVGQVMSSTPQSLAEIKAKSGIEKNWVWNYVNELVAKGFVEKVGTKYKKKKPIPSPTGSTGTVEPPKVEPEPAKAQTLGEKYGVDVTKYASKYPYAAEVMDTAKGVDNNLSPSQLTSIYDKAKKEWDAAQAGETPAATPPVEPAKPTPQAAPSTPSPEPAKAQATPSWVPQAKPYDDALKEAKTQDPHAGAWGPKAKGNVSYGAVLVNDKGQVLIREPANHWNGEHWTFAKGGSDPGDLPADTAVRELLEETGYKGSLVEPLPGVHKEGKNYWNNYYYVAKAEGEPGQFDHETWSTKWVSPDEAADYIKKTTNKDARDRDLSVLSSLQAMNATKTGFTGKITDALGREVCFDAGKKIECPKAAEPKVEPKPEVKPEPPKVEPAKTQTLGEKYGVAPKDYKTAHDYGSEVYIAAKAKDPGLSIAELNNVYDQAKQEWKDNAGKSANPFPAGSKQASAFDKAQTAIATAKAGLMTNPLAHAKDILNGPTAGMTQQQKHELLNKLGIPSQMGDSTTSQLTQHLQNLSAGKNPSSSAAKPTKESKKPLDPNATEIPHSLYTGPGKDWPGSKPDSSISYAPEPGEESSPLFKQYKDDEERKPWFTSNSELIPSFNAHAKKVEGTLTPAEKKATKSYTGSGYHSFNASMRQCPETLDCLSPSQKKMAQDLEKAIAKGGVFEQPITVWRKLSIGAQETAEFVQVMENALNSGADVRMPSIKSTSISPKGWSGNVCLEIRARTGIYVDHYSSNPGEREILQGHNTRYRVTGIKEVPWAGSSGKKKIIQLEELTP